MQDFIDQLRLEREDLHDDINGMEFLEENLRVGDFGCEYGYTTLSLALELNAYECIGIDKFEHDNNSPYVPTLEEVNRIFDNLKGYTLAGENAENQDCLFQDVRSICAEGRLPIFQKGNLITGINLPTNLDFVYCKQVLYNLYEGGYNNPKGLDGIKASIKNIMNSVKRSGQVCIVEPVCSIDFRGIINQVGLKLVRQRLIFRNDIVRNDNGLISRATSHKSKYFIYYCIKRL